MSKLKSTWVVFDESAHTYHLGGVALSGVTPIIDWVYPRTYDNISEEVLRRAAEHGTMIHKQCELSDSGFEVDTREVIAYNDMKNENGKETLCNEYLVSDEERIASSIDVVFTDYSIADIKTTSQIHNDNVRLQLSIYAWLFERMNPTIKVPEIWVIWLPRERYGNPDMRMLERIPSETCEKVVNMYFEGADYHEAQALLGGGTTILKRENEMPATFYEAEKELARIMVEAKKSAELAEVLRRGMLATMKEYGVKKWESDNLTLTLKDAYIRYTVDSKKLKEQHPDIYKECIKESKVKESLLINLK